MTIEEALALKALCKQKCAILGQFFPEERDLWLCLTEYDRQRFHEAQKVHLLAGVKAVKKFF
jgi:hypothetical protein